MVIDPSFMGGTMGTTVTSYNPGPLISAENIYLHTPNLVVTIRGRWSTATLLGATIVYGMDVGIASATVDYVASNFRMDAPNRPDPTGDLDGIDYFDEVKIYAGSNAVGPNYQALRFTGVFLRAEATMWPGVWQMVCKGNLYRATQYFVATALNGIPTNFFPSGAPVGAPAIDFPLNDGSVLKGYSQRVLGVDCTDDNLVFDILNQVPDLSVDFNDIDGCHFFILFAIFEATWPPYRSAWEQVQLFDQAYLGFRTFENLGGRILRSRIYGYPSMPSDINQFTEGVDIWEAQGTRSVEDLVNSSYVEGMTSAAGGSLGDVQVVYAYVPSGNNYQSLPVVEQFRSPFIELSERLDPDHRFNVLYAEDVAKWRLAERNRERVNVTLVTYRDDQIGAGRVIAVDSPHAGLTQPMWVQRVEIRVQANPPLFQQTIYGVGGGTPDQPFPAGPPQSLT